MVKVIHSLFNSCCAGDHNILGRMVVHDDLVLKDVNIFKCIFLKENSLIIIQISDEFLHKGPAISQQWFI